MANSSLRESFAIQRRVVGALLLREVITRYGRHGIGILWLIVEPMLFTLGVTALWYFSGEVHGTGARLPIIAFAISGYSTVLLWRNTANRMAKAIEPNLALMYHRNVKVIDIFVSRALLEIIGATASLVVLTVVFASVGAMNWPDDFVLVLYGWLLTCWFGLGLGLIVAALSERSDTFERVWHVMLYLMFPVSGALYMVDWLPHSLQQVVLWLPMVHGVEMIRHGYFGNAIATYEDPGYMAMVNGILLLIGLAMARESARHVEPG